MSSSSKSNHPSKTILVITVGFVVLFFLTKKEWMLYVAMSVGVLGAISTFLAEKIDWLWTKLAWLLSKIVPNILMTIIFYCVLTPIALLSRLFGKKDPMDLKNTQESLWKSKNTVYSKESFEKPW